MRTMTRQFESLIPILNVSDFQTSTKHYAEKLGFRKVWEWGEPPTIGCVTRDGIEIFFCLAGQCQPGMWMSIFVNDVDGLYDELRERRSEEHTSELQSLAYLVCRLLLEKKQKL